MGSSKEEEEASDLEYERVVKTSTACFWSIVVSVVGGLILGWWEYQYHPTYRQLWMVPFGLILFGTPVIVWFSVLASEIWNLRDDHVTTASQLVHPPSNSVPAKKDDEWRSNHVADV